VIATDSIKNIVNLVARENLRLSTKEYDVAIAKIFLDGYPQVERVNVELVETQWQRYHSTTSRMVSALPGSPMAIRSQKSSPRGLHRDFIWRR
jgi:urate oxidase